jgi:hypothetical protein
MLDIVTRYRTSTCLEAITDLDAVCGRLLETDLIGLSAMQNIASLTALSDRQSRMDMGEEA